MNRPSFQTWLIASISALLPAWAARAGPVSEAEADGAAANNTIASAQLLSPAAFTPASSPSIFGSTTAASISGRAGGSDVDVYAFDVTAPVHAFFDIDAAAFDTYLALFDAAGTVLAANDDSFPADPGSDSDLDAFIGVYTLTAPGRYYIAVSAAPNVPLAAFSGTLFPELARPDGAFGGNAMLDADVGVSDYLASGPQFGDAYTLHVSVPAPGAAALLAAAGGWPARRRRR